MSVFRSIVVLGLLALSPSLRAIDTNVPANGLPTAAEYSASMLPERQGVLSWKSLATVEQVKEGAQVQPRFSREILDLDKQPVRVEGFILALEVGEQHKHFLVSAVPPHCSFCMPAGPEAIVEVFARKAVHYRSEPILMAGKLAVLRSDPSGVLYQLTEAEPVDDGAR